MIVLHVNGFCKLVHHLFCIARCQKAQSLLMQSFQTCRVGQPRQTTQCMLVRERLVKVLNDMGVELRNRKTLKRTPAGNPERSAVIVTHSASMMVTLAIPPPSHIVCKPQRFPRARSAWTSVVISRAPEAPSG